MLTCVAVVDASGNHLKSLINIASSLLLKFDALNHINYKLLLKRNKWLNVSVGIPCALCVTY